MTKTQEIFTEAVSLPIEMRTKLVDQILKSLHPTQKKIDTMWATEAEKRVKEIKSGKTKTIPGEEVFRKIRKRLGS